MLPTLLILAASSLLHQQHPTFLAPGAGFSKGWGMGKRRMKQEVELTQATLLGQFLTGHWPVLVQGPRVGDPCPTHKHKLKERPSHFPLCLY